MFPHWLIAVLIGQGIICGLYCYTVAEAKGHNVAIWFLGGLLFGIIALIAVAGMPLTSEKVFERKKQIEVLSKKKKLTTAEIGMLKKSCQEMPEEELVKMLLEDKTNYEEGVYALLLKEAYIRGIRQEIRGEKIEDLIKKHQNRE